MGETHPQVRKWEGESYREELLTLARELGVSRQVRFTNQYLTQNHLIRYLQATDIYVTPYRDRNQITSGTLSYALGCGRAIVSTPYVYAAEALADEDRGARRGDGGGERDEVHGAGHALSLAGRRTRQDVARATRGRAGGIGLTRPSGPGPRRG